jgi:hypothetical protein
MMEASTSNLNPLDKKKVVLPPQEKNEVDDVNKASETVCFLFLAWWPSWLEVGITGHNFGRGPSKDHSTKVWLQLAQWFIPIKMFLSETICSIRNKF